MKNKVISVVVVIIMLVAIGFAYKTGRLNVNPGAVSDNGQEIAHGPVLKEPEKHTSFFCMHCYNDIRSSILWINKLSCIFIKKWCYGCDFSIYHIFL